MLSNITLSALGSETMLLVALLFAVSPACAGIARLSGIALVERRH